MQEAPAEARLSIRVMIVLEITVWIVNC